MSHSGIGLLQVGSAGVLWGSAPVALAVVQARTPLSALAVSAHRLVIGALVLLAVTIAAGRARAVLDVVCSSPVRVVAIGVGVASYQSLWFAAIHELGAGVATVVSIGLAPIVLTAWESVSTRSRPRPTHLVATTAGVLGLILVSVMGASEDGTAVMVASDPVLGLVLATLSGLLVAATTVIGRHVAQSTVPGALTPAVTAVGAIVLLPAAALDGPMITTDPVSIAALAFLGLVTIAVGFTLLYAGLKSVPASAAALAVLLEPATAAVLGVALLGERLTVVATAGIVLILGAVAGLRRM